jgi:hypothetical protein
VEDANAIFTSMPGADKIAKQTGAIVVASCEVVNLLRKAGVPDSQLMAVQGGERVPLFTKDILKQTSAGTLTARPGPPGAPLLPHTDHASLQVDVWPALHCLLPSHDDIPEVMDTGKVWTGSAHPFVCTLDVNFGMKHGLLRLDELVPAEHRNAGMRAFIDYIKDREANLFSDHDGGQLMYNVHLKENTTLLWNAHLGGYEGILRYLQPKPKFAILGIAGRANHNGRPFDGSAAQYVVKQLQWLEEPKEVIWCLHDERYVLYSSAHTLRRSCSTSEQCYSAVLHRYHSCHPGGPQ